MLPDHVLPVGLACHKYNHLKHVIAYAMNACWHGSMRVHMHKCIHGFWES